MRNVSISRKIRASHPESHHSDDSHGELKHPTVCWEGSRAGHKQARRFLQGVEDSVLTETLNELSRAGLFLTDRVGLPGDGKEEGSHGCYHHEMVEK